MKANNFNLWFRLTVGSAIGAIVYHFSSGRKTEKLRKMVRMRNQIKESENKGEIYKLSPYKLLWNGDYYYVIGYSEKKNKVICFRVDRIAGTPEMLDKDIIPMPEDFDMENFTKEVFFMFSGEKVLVDLRCDNSLMKTMVDRFGEDVTTLAYDMTSFRIQTEVSASQTFFGWVFGFNGKVQILGPESVREQYRQMIAKANMNM